jgi:hypothetical protein
MVLPDGDDLPTAVHQTIRHYAIVGLEKGQALHAVKKYE